jgi:hypothetical protein
MERFSQIMKEYIKESGGRTKASGDSFGDIQKLLKDGEATSSNGRLEKGMMYVFRYFTPSEPMWDSYPVVIGLGRSDDGHQLGINLHYIPYLTRVAFVQNFLDSYKGSIRESTIGTKALTASKQSPINTVSYEQIKHAFGSKYNITYAVRQYMLKRMRKPIQLSYEKWHLGVVNDENYFIGTNINEAQSQFFANI